MVDNYRFVGERGLLIRTLVGAVQTAAQKLLECGDLLDPVLKTAIQALASAPRSGDSYEALETLRNLQELRLPSASWDSPEAMTRRLANTVWYYTFMHYYWLAEQRKNTSGKA